MASRGEAFSPPFETAGPASNLHMIEALAPTAAWSGLGITKASLEPHMASEFVKEFTDANFESEVLKSPVPVLVDFWAEWCMPCRNLAPVVESVAKKFGPNAKVGKIDIDAHKEVSMKYGITAIPTLIVFKGGQVVSKLVGYQKEDKLAAALTEAASK